MDSRTAAFVILIGLACTAGPRTTFQGQVPSGSEFAAVFERYLHGDADAAVRELAAWPETRVDAEGGPLPEGAWMLAARALLHTEAGIVNETFAARAGGLSPAGSGPLEVHARTAIAAIEKLAPTCLDEPALADFCRHWTIFVGSFQQRVFQAGAFPDPLTDLARTHLGATADVKLLLAARAEKSMGPLINRAHNSNAGAARFHEDESAWVSTRNGLFSGSLRSQAESFLRDALRADPALAEARLRLGRIGHLVGRPRPSEARALLERALADGRAANDRFVSYMAALFLGALHEQGRRDEEAARLYRAAIDLEPRAHPAYVALSGLRLGQGRTGEAWTVMTELFAAAGPGGDIWSPWALYPFAQFHQSAERLDAMRRLVAKQFGRERRSTLPFPHLDAPPPRTRVATLAPSSGKPQRATDGQQPASGFRTSVEGVRIDVTVMDGDEPLTGLTAEDFWVLDNGRAQRIESVAAIPHLAVALAIDISHTSSAPLRAQLLPAAREVVNALRPGDRVSLVTIDDSVRVLRRGDADLPGIREILGTIQNARRGYTALWDGAYAAASLVAEDPGRPVVALFSQHHDEFGGGKETMSWLGFEQARDRFKASGVPIDAVWSTIHHRGDPDVGYPDRTDVVWGRWLGDDVVKATGGLAFRLEDPGVADQIRERLDRLRSGYILTYVPTGVRTGDGWHTLEVRLRHKRGQVTARPGYYSGRSPR